MYLQEAVGISAVFTQEVAYPMLRTIYANFEEYLCVTLCAGMILCLALQVSIRMIWGSALAWTEELSRYCFIWTVYIGMSLATKRLAQVRITAQFLKMPLKMRLFFRILSDMICVAFNVMIAWYAWEVIRENYEFPEISPTLGIVKAHVEMSIPCTFLLTSWRIIEIYLRRIKEGTLYSLVKNVGEEDTDGYA